MSKLRELKARKEKVDRMTELFRTLREEEEGEREGAKGRMAAAPPVKPPDDIAEELQFAKSAQATEGASELVDPGDTAASPNIEELQRKLRWSVSVCTGGEICLCACCCREAADARMKLLKSQKLFSAQDEVMVSTPALPNAL